jgi:hypothetical protein
MEPEYGWLIESYELGMVTKKPQYLRVIMHGGTAQVTWTEDSEVALRFARAEDAANFARMNPQHAVLAKITDHYWMRGRPYFPPKDASERAQSSAGGDL